MLLERRLADGIVAALDRMADPPERATMVTACRDWAAEFGWERMHDEAREVAVSAIRAAAAGLICDI